MSHDYSMLTVRELEIMRRDEEIAAGKWWSKFRVRKEGFEASIMAVERAMIGQGDLTAARANRRKHNNRMNEARRKAQSCETRIGWIVEELAVKAGKPRNLGAAKTWQAAP